jgi:hypothetical protein
LKLYSGSAVKSWNSLLEKALKAAAKRELGRLPREVLEQ